MPPRKKHYDPSAAPARESWTPEQMAQWFIGKQWAFNMAFNGRVQGKCVRCKYIGRHDPSGLHNFTLHIRGQSGRTVKVDLIEQRAQMTPE